jgi:PAS domain S-box-containing protein
MSRKIREPVSDSNLPSLVLEENRQRQIFLLFVGFCILGLSVFGISHFFLSRPIHGVLNLVAVGFFCVLLLLSNRPKRARAVHRTFVLMVLVLFLFWVREGGTTGQPSAAMWIYIFPLLSLFLLGSREGLIWTSILALGILIQFLLPKELQRFPYSTEFEIRYLGSLALVTILAYNYEAVRAAYWQRISRQRETLEVLVAQRTSELEKTNAELRESEQRYRLLADNASDLIWTTDRTFRLTFVSPSIQTLCGYKVEEASHLPLCDWFTPESYRTLLHVFETRFSSDESRVHDCLTLELEQQRKDGTAFPIELKLSTVRGLSGEPIGLLGISRDISERKERQELLIQAEKMMSISGLAAGMAHEINNPLASALHSIDLIRSRLLVDSPENRSLALACGTTFDGVIAYLNQRKVTKMLQAAADSTERLSNITRTMLGFSRRSDKSFSMYDVREILDSTLVLASTDFALNKVVNFKEVEISKDYDNGVPLVPCDPISLQQVFLNIIKNGAEAMFEQGNPEKRPRFYLGIFEQPESVRIEIEDNGPGLNPETKSRIFEPFFTTKPAGQGTGLGLSVSYFIITENHRGQMTMETQKGVGTKFIICLPKTTGSAKFSKGIF